MIRLFKVNGNLENVQEDWSDTRPFEVQNMIMNKTEGSDNLAMYTIERTMCLTKLHSEFKPQESGADSGVWGWFRSLGLDSGTLVVLTCSDICKNSSQFKLAYSTKPKGVHKHTQKKSISKQNVSLQCRKHETIIVISTPIVANKQTI